MDKIIMTKSELIKLGEEFCDALEYAFRDYDYVSVGREGFDYYRGSPMYGCTISVGDKELTDEEFSDIENTIDSVCSDWDEKTDYGWVNGSGFFWVAICIDEIAPDPVSEDECPTCGTILIDNGDGMMFCPNCNPMEEMEEEEEEEGEEEGPMVCEECGEEKEQDDDGIWFCPNCREEDERFCEECGQLKKEDDDGNMYCPYCREEQEREKEQERRDDAVYDGICPFCGEELEDTSDFEKECPNCGWDEDYDGNGEMCPMCNILLKDDSIVLYCPECGWTDEECPYCGETTWWEDGGRYCRECGWDHNYDGDGEVCPECNKLLIQEDGWYKCPHCDWSQLEDKSNWTQEDWDRYHDL